jgi:hypothetical protein
MTNFEIAEFVKTKGAPIFHLNSEFFIMKKWASIYLLRTPSWAIR